MSDPTRSERPPSGGMAYNAAIIEIRRIHDELIVLRLRPDAGVPPHEAGQFVTIGLEAREPLAAGCVDRVSAPVSPDRLIKRAYSLSSSLVGPDGELLRPDDEDFLELYITLVRDDDPKVPSLTGRIFALEPGSRLWVHPTVAGRYTLDRAGVTSDDAILFLASGVGEAPHNAMLLALARRGHRGPIASVVSVRHSRDLAYLDAHRRLEEILPRYRYVPLITREPGLPKVHIQDLLRAADASPLGRERALDPRRPTSTSDLDRILGFPLDPDRTHVFVCGNPALVGAPKPGDGDRPSYTVAGGVIELLAERGFVPDFRGRTGNIHYESFW